MGRGLPVAVVALLLLPTTPAAAHWPGLVLSDRTRPADPGRFKDAIQHKIVLTNFKPYDIHAKCRISMRSIWWADVDNDGIKDAGTRETYPKPRRFRVAVPEGERFIRVFDLGVRHPDKGPEDPTVTYGDDHFSGWEFAGMLSFLMHCHPV